MSLFTKGEYFPPEGHKERVERYLHNKHVYKGNHDLVFNQNTLSESEKHLIYISLNIAGVIAKKSSDLLFGEAPTYSAGKDDNSNEQKAIERLVSQNNLNATNSKSSLGNAYRGDSFYKIRWGQEYGGLLSEANDPYRVFIESQKAEYVFPETLAGDNTKIFAYHIAVPTVVANTGDEKWLLNVESHYSGRIEYSQHELTPFMVSSYENRVNEWKIGKEITSQRRTVETGVPLPLVVHIPNYATDDDWEGIDDLTELLPIIAEINNRLSQIAIILDMHSTPTLIVPEGTLEENENGELIFRVGTAKVFEIPEGKTIKPEYVTWDGKLDSAFRQLEFLVEHLLSIAELPPVALGMTDTGTSGSSGLGLKYRMSSLLSKINRKRQYYDMGLKQALLIAQMLEHAKSDKVDYEITLPKIHFKDGLPDDVKEQSIVAQIRTGGKATQSQLGAIMDVHGITEEQARIELARIKEEEKEDDFVSSTVFNDTGEE